jgi:uncharacterized protein
LLHVTGTLINAGTVLVGTVVGTLLGERLPDRIREIVIDGLGLVVLVVGMDGAFSVTRAPLTELLTGSSVFVVLGSVLIGAILGELVRIEAGLNAPVNG